VLAGNRHVNVHRVPQRLGLVEILHPDRRPMAEWVDGVVAGQLGIPEDGPPEADIDGLGVCRDGELDLLCTAATRGGSLLSRDGRDRSCKLDVSRRLARVWRLPELAPPSERSGRDPAGSCLLVRAAELREGDREADERSAVLGGDRGGALDHGGGDRVVPGDTSASVDPVRRFGVVVEYGGLRP
jgi:hypothetical protein